MIKTTSTNLGIKTCTIAATDTTAISTFECLTVGYVK